MIAGVAERGYVEATRCRSARGDRRQGARASGADDVPTGALCVARVALTRSERMGHHRVGARQKITETVIPPVESRNLVSSQSAKKIYAA